MSDAAGVELIVQTDNPDALDAVLAQLPTAQAQVVEGSWNGCTRSCRVLAFGDVGFLRSALVNQGCARVLHEAPASR